MSSHKQGRLAYNPETKRFGMLIADLWDIDGFHCGSTFEIYDSEKDTWIPTRIEMSWPDQKYYLVNTQLKDDDLEGLKIRITTEEY